MPRWLIAVFTLHFLLSVGSSAFGKTPPAGAPLTGSAHAISVVLAADAAHESTVDAAADLRDHGLTDGTLDLPDDQNMRTALCGSGHPLFACPAALAAAPASALPKKRPKRPRA